jgi:peptide/nickel transport system substrate-binding protein
MPARVVTNAVIAGFRVQSLIGAGSMGSVYLAEDTRTGEQVALKVMTAGLAEDERFRQRFARESALAATLDHPHVVRTIASGEADGLLFLAMAHVEGSDLREVLRREGRLEPDRALRLVAQAADALDAAHAAGLVHRDVKPGNILIGSDADGEHAYVCDFGLARHVSSVSSLTGERGFVGTIDYVPPEQIQGGAIDSRTDVYSLGCVLFECLAGARPFERESELAVVFAHLNEPSPRITESRPELPAAFDEVFATALAKLPDDRYQTCGELAESAQAALRGTLPARPKARRGRRLVSAAAVLAAAAAVGGGIVLARSQTTAHRAIATAADELVGVDVGTGRISSSLSRTGAPVAMASGGGSIWIADADAKRVLQVDRVSGEVVDRIPLPVQPGDIAVGGGAVWVTGAIDGSITRIDRATGRITQRIPLGSSPSGFSFSGGTLWVGDGEHQALLAIDAATGKQRHPISLTTRPAAIAAGTDRVWVASLDAPTVMEIDALTGTTIATVHVGQGPSALAFGAGSVWVANKRAGTVSRIDAHTGKVVATIATGSGPTALAFAGGKLWVANEYSGTVSRIDPASAAVDASVDVHGSATSFAAAGQTLWIGVSRKAAHRGGTLVLLTPARFGSIDPQIDAEVPSSEFLGLANDGLVAFDHTPGSNRVQVVPDLALALPTPTDGGRTYAFRLRPGIRYSDGRPVRASDFARAVPRLFRVKSPGMGSFAGVVGGQACVADHNHCRLSRGVVADDAKRVVTFHLTAPDPDFFYTLANGFLVPVPPGTPLDIGVKPLPGTGPYRIASATAREIRFVRNAGFREWSRAAQPDGNADEIVWRFGLTESKAVAAVERGEADYTEVAGAADVRRLALQHPAQLHANPSPTTVFVQINTRRPPFNDLRARQALNFAVDRGRNASAATSVTCQVIPPGTLGYRRYCPYTLHPKADGAWSAPDLRRARALVAASGTRGARVTVWTHSDTGDPEEGVPYLVGLLRKLGYHARYQILTTKQINAAPASFRATMQLLPIAWGEFTSPADFFSTFLACDGSYTWQQFCDPKFDREIAQAESLRLTDPARSAKLWARLDRETVDRALWLPVLTLNVVEFVSSRVQQYQYSRAYHFLPAQAWLQ